MVPLFYAFVTDDNHHVKSVGDSLPMYLSLFNTLPLVSFTFIICAICTSLCFPTDVPHPSDGSVSVVALNEAGKIRVTWSTPTLGPGQVITGYSVQYRRNGTTSYTTRSVSGYNTTTYNITNLILGAVYEVRVASEGPLGLSGYCCGSRSEKWVTTYNCEST